MPVCAYCRFDTAVPFDECPKCGHPAEHEASVSGRARTDTEALAGEGRPASEGWTSVAHNTSGQKGGALVPPEVLGWNWGAFLLNWIWGLGNRVYLGLLVLLPVPLVGLVVAVVLGVKGNEWAWRNKRWESVEAFKRTQRRWRNAAFIVVPVLVAGLTLLAIVGAGDTQAPKVLSSQEGSVSITVPGDWQEDDALNPEADIQASRRSSERYVVVFSQPQAEVSPDMTLPAFSDLRTSAFVEELGLERVSGPQEVTTDSNHPMIQHELSGTVDGVEIAYLYSVVESASHYVEVIAWTLLDRYEGSRAAFQEITASVHAR